jgi:O-antigen ligase/Flp pilus assembly protein TadD
MNRKNSEISQFFQKIIFSLFNLLIFLTPFVFTWLNQELFEFNKMIFVYGLTILIVTVWIFRIILEKRFIFQKTKFDYFLLAFFLSQLLSTLFSMHPRTSVFGYYTRFNGGLLSIISYITLFYAFVSNIEKKQIKIILESLLISSFLISLYAIPEHFGHSPSCLLITQKFDVSCWVQKVQERVFATFGQPNWLAAYLISIIPINLSLLLREKKTAKKIFLILNLAVMTAALLFTRSRSGMLGLSIALSVFSIAKILTSKKKERKVTTIKITGVALLMSLLVLVIGTPYTPNLKALINRNEITTEIVKEEAVVNRLETGGTASEDIRKVVWQGALNVWKRYPILGSGAETFAYSYYQDRPIEHNLLSEWDFLYNKAHNEILNFMATTGSLGLLSYLGLFAIFFYSVFKTRNEKESLAIAAAIIAMFISNVIGFSTVMTNLMMFSYFAIIALYSLKIEKVENNNETTNNFQFFLLGLTAIVASVLLNKTFSIWQADYLFTQGSTFCSQGDYQTGISYIQKAIEKSPKEALFYDDLAKNYSQLAIAFAEEQESTVAAQLAKAAIESNEYALRLNPVHLNFHKSKARLFIRLAKLDRELYYYAKEALETAITLSPTDAKLYYNLALVEEVLENDDEAQKILEHTIFIKENYPQARNELARLYAEMGNLEEAQKQYRYILDKINPEDKLVQEKLRVVEASIAAQKE